MAVEVDLGDHALRQPDPGAVDQRGVTGDHRGLFQRLHPLPAGRGRQAPTRSASCCTVRRAITLQGVEQTTRGRKRKIDQSACNKDCSCANGFCPSFVSVLGGTLRKPLGALGHGSSAGPEALQQHGLPCPCKDEYELARLYTDGRFRQQLRAQFDVKLANVALAHAREAELLHRFDPPRWPRPAPTMVAGQIRGVAVVAG